MANTALLNNIEHGKLRVLAHHAPEFGDSVSQCVVVPTEFTEVQREYPIFFRKDSNGEYQAIALLGLADKENLFLGEKGWEHARYVPAILQRGPFLIGKNRDVPDGEDLEGLQILVDLDNPRISKDDQGVEVFKEQGGNSRYLEQVIRVLRILYLGDSLKKKMFDAFEKEGVIAPMSVEIEVGPRSTVSMKNYFGIDPEKLAALDGAALKRLNKGGYLQAAYMVLASQTNIHHLIDLKNRRAQNG